jgi:hypothetical protein
MEEIFDGHHFPFYVATMNLHLQSGVVADSGAVICLSALVSVPGTFFGAANVGTDVRLHGYLIPR